MTSSMPSLRATAAAVVRLSPVSMTIRMFSLCSCWIASGVVCLMGSATPISPAALPSTATNIIVWPSARPDSAASTSESTLTWASSMSLRLPRRTATPSTRALTPLPVTDSNASTDESWILRASAPATIAAARGCSLARSRLAASRNSRTSSKSFAGWMLTRWGFPSVSVPVLSTTRVSTFRMNSIASAFLKSTPMVAPLPIATMIDIGVANPSAQGQAIINTATALIRAWAIRGEGPANAQIMNVTTALPTTVGTK